MTCLIFLISLLTLNAAEPEFEISRLFGDHMVMQREKPVRIWGKGKAGEQVMIILDRTELSIRVNEQGEWEVFYPEHSAGGPYRMEIYYGNQKETIEDIYFGDVWVASGQSNMEWRINWKIENTRQAIKEADYPKIRFFTLDKAISAERSDRLLSGNWIPASSETVGEFSAVAWFFAKQNHLDKGVPVGIINSSWGGSPIEAWIDPNRLTDTEGYADAAREMISDTIDWEKKIQENEENEERKWQMISDTSYSRSGVQSLDFDDSSWEGIDLPNSVPLNNIVWLRKEVNLASGEEVHLYFGDINQLARIYFNGHLVAVESWQDTTEIVHIPGMLVREGENSIALRAINSWDNRVMVGRPGELWLCQNGDTLSLESSWKFSTSVEPEFPPVEFLYWLPGMIYNQMICPLSGYSISGFLWYQGESNVEKARYYNTLLETMVKNWREVWEMDELPFLYVQLPNFSQRVPFPTESGWSELREAQDQALHLPNMGMATIIDLGDAEDIHPRKKKEVGDRLWLLAKDIVYGENVISSGPRYLRHRIDGNKVVLEFTDVGSGMRVKGNELKGFAIAGAAKVFVWANAEISNDYITLWNEKVSEPLYIRYAWGDNPECNLYNNEGLPALPFRTDQ